MEPCSIESPPPIVFDLKLSLIRPGIAEHHYSAVVMARLRSMRIHMVATATVKLMLIFSEVLVLKPRDGLWAIVGRTVDQASTLVQDGL
jgi:hypothetical protein